MGRCSRSNQAVKTTLSGHTGSGLVVAVRGGCSAAASPPSRRPPTRSTGRLSGFDGSKVWPTPRRSQSSLTCISPSTTSSQRHVEKLGWLLSKATRSFGERPVSDLRPAEIAAWRMTIPFGHRFEATQALRQTLARAVSWGMLNTNPAKRGVENPQRPRFEQRPFESWAEVHRLAGRIGRRYGPLVTFAAATGLRPGEWLALEHRDIDHQARVVYVRRALRNGRIKNPKTDGSIRAVPLQAIALAALRTPNQPPLPAPIPRPTRRVPRPAQLPLPRLETRPTRARHRPAAKDLRSQTHVRYLRAPCRSLHLRPLPLNGRQPDHDRPPLRPPRQRRPTTRDQPARYPHGRRPPRGRCVDAEHTARRRENPPQTGAKQQQKTKPSVGLEPTTPSLPWKVRGIASVHRRSRTGTKALQLRDN